VLHCSTVKFNTIYKLPSPEEKADDDFMKAFGTEYENYEECIKEWWYDEEDFKTRTLSFYPIQNFHPTYHDAAAMMCRLFGEKNCNMFKHEWTPVKHVVVEDGQVMNWANILVANSLGVVKKYKDAPRGKETPFYMATYLLDLICAAVHFPEFKL